MITRHVDIITVNRLSTAMTVRCDDMFPVQHAVDSWFLVTINHIVILMSKYAKLDHPCRWYKNWFTTDVISIRMNRHSNLKICFYILSSHDIITVDGEGYGGRGSTIVTYNHARSCCELTCIRKTCSIGGNSLGRFSHEVRMWTARDRNNVLWIRQVTGDKNFVTNTQIINELCVLNSNNWIVWYCSITT
jgi:hypothetical protein